MPKIAQFESPMRDTFFPTSIETDIGGLTRLPAGRGSSKTLTWAGGVLACWVGGRKESQRAGGRGWDSLKPLHQLDLLHGGGAQHLIIISGRCLCSGGQCHQRRGEEDSLSSFLNHFYFLSCNHFCLCQLGSVLDKDPYGLKALVMFQ